MILKKILLAALLSFPLLSNAQSTNTNNPFVLNPTNSAAVPPFPPNSGQYHQSNLVTHATFDIETNGHWKSVDEYSWTNKIATNGVFSIQNSTGTQKLLASNGNLSISGQYSGNAIGLTNLNPVALFPYLGSITLVHGKGESVINGYSSAQPFTSNGLTTNLCQPNLLASALQCSSVNYAAAGRSAGGMQWDDILRDFQVYTANTLFVIAGGPNDIMGNTSYTSVTNPLIPNTACQVTAANLAWMSFISSDVHPTAQDCIATNNHYGYTNGGSQWSSNTVQSWWYNIAGGNASTTGAGKAMLSTHAGDTFTLTNILTSASCPGVIALFDIFLQNPSLGGTISISVDGTLAFQTNCNSMNLGLTQIFYSNVTIGVPITISTPGVHVMVVSNVSGNVAFAAMLQPARRTATNTILYDGLYQQPNYLNGFQVTNYNAYLQSMISSLDGVGLDCRYVDCYNLTSWELGSDGIHPDAFGNIDMSSRNLNALTGSYLFGNTWLFSFGMSNAVAMILNSGYGGTNYYAGAVVVTNANNILAGNGGGVTNIASVQTSAATSGTVTPTATNQVQSLYLSSGSTILSITIALPTAGYAGQTFYIHSKSIVTTLSVTGGSFIDTAVTSMTAGQTLGYQNTSSSGAYIRIQ